MKILRVVPFPPEHIGGLPYYCKNISINLAKRKNVECDIIAPDIFKRHKGIEYLDNGVKVIYEKCQTLLAGKNPVANIIPFLKKNYGKYDLVHAHGYYYFTTLQCALFKKLRNYPFILHLHGGIQTPYNPVSSISENLQLIFKEKLFDKTIGKIPFNAADAIISVAKKDLSIVQERYKINKERSYFIPNGVDISRFKRDNNIERKFITIIATRLSYIKGVDIYIELIKELYKANKNLKFLIIGNGVGRLRNLVLESRKKYPLQFYTSYPYEQIQDIYNKSKLILITSRTEGVPNIIYESLACETPVISSNVGGISHVIIPNKNGFLFDINHYRDAIPLILDLVNDDKKIRDLGRNGRKLIENEYSWEAITDKIYNVYKKF